MKGTIIFLGLLLICLPIMAENITDLEIYQNMKASQALYLEAYDAGNYEKAYDIAQDVGRYAEELKAYLNGQNQEPQEPEITAEPEPETETVAEPEIVREPEQGEYKVVRGDTLWDISAKQEIYNDPKLWPLIYNANKQVLVDPENPDLIHGGMLFQIPPKGDE
ncbi:MAG: LysM peptidoglycan-binding domain-containing protein [Spirochaetaceae bacterium]|jgi:nucleoid-associated protein YgaU|nr:LysM peptidoglycan-binding domain-containing protein [Spirochaetaceae bacterium]